VLFWLVLLLPMVLVARLVTWRHPEEGENGHHIAAVGIATVQGRLLVNEGAR